MPKMYRKKSDHRILVEKVGEGFIRLSETVKFRAVSYRDRKGNVDARQTETFHEMFEPVK